MSIVSPAPFVLAVLMVASAGASKMGHISGTKEVTRAIVIADKAPQ